ncbi:pantoate--beta-alanine ligase, partial [bacterium]|nr:pantoate--beta-alanine ligase [bacterium]
MTTIIHSVKDWILIRRSLKDQSLGFIPTMGALHAGHLELVKKSLSENTLTMVS